MIITYLRVKETKTKLYLPISKNSPLQIITYLRVKETKTLFDVVPFDIVCF